MVAKVQNNHQSCFPTKLCHCWKKISNPPVYQNCIY